MQWLIKRQCRTGYRFEIKGRQRKGAFKPILPIKVAIGCILVFAFSTDRRDFYSAPLRCFGEGKMKYLAIAVLALLTFGGVANAACNNPDDRASDGSRCGGRASSERPGGR